jgi:hypothetical protein
LPDDIDMKKTQSKVPEAPESLRRLQLAFGHSIATPFLFGELDGVECQVDKYDPLAVSQMVARGALTGVERLAVYNQQYWFRLLTVMQEEYPLMERILGVREFNKLVTDYLSVYPSIAPSLRYLSDRFVDFLTSDAAGAFGSSINIQTAKLEYLYIQAFDAEELGPLTFATMEQAEAAMSNPLRFQPHVGFSKTDWALVEARRAIRKDPEIKTIIPEEKTEYWSVFRGKNGVSSHQLDRLQWPLIQALFAGQPFDEACESVAETMQDSDLEEFSQSIQGWFATWAALGWFASP